ncbi:hypothetical protein GCM10010433_62930 [Streptomyces pulveraceus]
MPWTRAEVETLPGFAEFGPLLTERERTVDEEGRERADTRCTRIRDALTMTFPKATGDARASGSAVTTPARRCPRSEGDRGHPPEVPGVRLQHFSRRATVETRPRRAGHVRPRRLEVRVPEVRTTPSGSGRRPPASSQDLNTRQKKSSD